MRVLFKSIILRQHAGGGSTISQQLVKNLFGRKKYGRLTMPVNKIKEGILANKLEHLYSKNEILMLYLNTVSFGEDTYGIEAASHRFFSKAPIDLKTEEAAVLIGMLKSPYNYNPRLHPQRSKNRRNTVIRQLLHYEYITEDQHKKLQESSIELRYTRLTKDVGSATHFRQYLRLKLEQWLIDNPNKDGMKYNLYTDGLTIFTTIHSKFQEFAEQSVNEHLAELDPILQQDLAKHNTLSESSTLLINAIKKQVDTNY
jgi:penicillin-binding protein 1A